MENEKDKHQKTTNLSEKAKKNQETQDDFSKLQHDASGDFIGGDKVVRDQYKADTINLSYRDELKVSRCPHCLDKFTSNEARTGGWITCLSCDRKSFDPAFEASLAQQYQGVPKNVYNEFCTIKSRIDNDIELGAYSESHRLSTKLTKICPEAPLSFFYNALTFYLSQDKGGVIETSANDVLKRVELANKKNTHDINPDLYSNICAKIAYNYYHTLRDAVDEITEQYLHIDDPNSEIFYDIFLKHINEFVTAYYIFNDQNFLTEAVWYLYGYKGYSWYVFSPNTQKFSSAAALIENDEYSIEPRVKKIDDIVGRLKYAIDSCIPNFKYPDRKIDFYKVTGEKSPLTLSNAKKKFQVGIVDISEMIHELEIVKNRLQSATSDDVKQVCEERLNNISNFIKVGNLINPRVYYAIEYGNKTIVRKKVSFRLFLHQSVKEKLNEVQLFSSDYDKVWSVVPYLPSFNTDYSIYKSVQLDYIENSLLLTVDDDNNVTQHQNFYLNKTSFKDQVCTRCNGDKYIVCQTCDGHHRTVCRNCRGKGDVACGKCKSRGNITCPKCSGHGRLVKDDEVITCQDSVTGPGCNGSGVVRCNSCHGKTRINCYSCSDGYKYCENCYGDDPNSFRYGKQDCEKCRATGRIVYFEGVDTSVEESINIYLFDENFKLVREVEGEAYLDKIFTDSLEIYKNVNNVVVNSHNEDTYSIVEEIRHTLNHSTNSYPFIVSESISISSLGIVDVETTNIITGKTHQSKVHITPRYFGFDLSNDFMEAGESQSMLVDLVSKAFLTKSYVEKIDKLNELVMMIYLAKSHGKITEKEKDIIIANYADHMSKLTKKEQNSIIELMNAKSVPVFNYKYSIFSSKEKKDEVIFKLKQFLETGSPSVENVEKELLRKFDSISTENIITITYRIKTFFTTYAVSFPVMLAFVYLLYLFLKVVLK